MNELVANGNFADIFYPNERPVLAVFHLFSFFRSEASIGILKLRKESDEVDGLDLRIVLGLPSLLILQFRAASLTTIPPSTQ